MTPLPIVFAWALTLAYLPLADETLTTPQGSASIDTSGAFAQTLELSVTYDSVLSLYTTLETRDYYASGGLFAPFLSTYTIGIEVGRKRWAVGARHFCTHPTLSRGTQDSYRTYANETALYIRIGSDLQSPF